MKKIGELDLFPVCGWQAPPSYFISIGGLGYLTLSWLMYYIKQYLPREKGMDDFKGAHFMGIDTAFPDSYDLPPEDWAINRLFRMEGNLNRILKEVEQGLYPGIRDFYDDSPVAREARNEVGDLKDGAGTTRPFGRIGFFYNWERFYEKLVQFLQQPVETVEMRYGGSFKTLEKKQRRFFIISSLAGGTGSSCFLDVAAGLKFIKKNMFPNETWRVVGVFTLAEVLASDKKVDKELHRTRMKANTYAALKELNYFQSGQPFDAQYGRTGADKIQISNRMENDKLFDLVFLADTPNQDNEPLSGRMEVAQFLAQSVLHLGLTEINSNFFNRLQDSTALLLFKQEFPPLSKDDGEERQQYLFSSLGISTLELPIRTYNHYCCYCLTEKLLDHLFEITSTAADETLADQMAVNLRLTENSIDQLFTPAMHGTLASSENCMDLIRQAQNPMTEIRRLAGLVEMLPEDVIRDRAIRICDDTLQVLFPPGDEGPVKKQLDAMVGQGLLSHVTEIIDQLWQKLRKYRDGLQAELNTANSQARAGEAPGFLSQSDTPASIPQNKRLAGLLNEMEEAWSTWGNRIFQQVFRNRFIGQFDGQLYDIIDFFQRCQCAGHQILIWPYKIQFVSDVMANLQRLLDQYRSRLNYFQWIKSAILNRKNVILKDLNPVSRFRLTAIEPSQYLENLFLKHTGEVDSKLEQLTVHIKGHGLRLATGQNIKFDKWSGQPVEDLVNGLYAQCREAVMGTDPADDDLVKNSTPFYQIGLDHSFFLPKEQPSGFNHVIGQWKQKSNVSLLFDGTMPETSRYVISGCRIEEDTYSWQEVLNLPGLSPKEGGTPNQATILTLALGFPIQSVARVKDWFKHSYVPQTRYGWPLHLFKTELFDLMVEPYLGWIRLPNRVEAEELLVEAIKWQILSPVTTELEGDDPVETVFIDPESLSALPHRISEFFYDFKVESIGKDKNALMRALQEKTQYVVPLKHALLQSKSPESCKSATWQEYKNKIAANAATIDDLIQWLIMADFIEEKEGVFHMTDELYQRTIETTPEFAAAFFSEEKPVQRKIRSSEFVNALTWHKPLSRWITKKVLRILIHPNLQQDTKTRLANNSFGYYLEEVLSSYFPFGTSR